MVSVVQATLDINYIVADQRSPIQRGVQPIGYLTQCLGIGFTAITMACLGVCTDGRGT